MTGCGDECGVDLAHANRHERRILIIVLLINAGMFVAEFSAGLVSGSTALLADSLDMLADALIYALGLFAIGRAAHWRARAALTSGIFQLLLGIGVAVEALWKTVADGLPDVATMGQPMPLMSAFGFRSDLFATARTVLSSSISIIALS